MEGKNDLEKRLANLPRKQSEPLRQLLSLEHLSEAALVDILDAGELSGNHGKLLGFAVSYLHLTSQGIPVRDVIALAKSQQRRINLSWSPKRWQAEHERLSRAETLKRLSAENVAYDLTQFEALLPDQFDGYLIRSSRRLGMEGLRQRHCVASYHHRLLAGHCAIAAVFVDRQRWTVELALRGTPEVGLYIDQIKTRSNGLPTPEIRERIYGLLSVAAPPRYVPPPAVERTYMDILRRPLPVLREHQIQEVRVSFNGSGDEGSIDDILFNPSASAALESACVSVPTRSRYFENGCWLDRIENKDMGVNEVLDELTYDYLEETGVNWYDNDGGFGELVIDVEQAMVELDVSVRFTESSCQFSQELEIG